MKKYTLYILFATMGMFSAKAITDPLVVSNFDGVNNLPTSFFCTSPQLCTLKLIADPSVPTQFALEFTRPVTGAITNGPQWGTASTVFTGGPSAGVITGTTASTQYHYLVVKMKKGTTYPAQVTLQNATDSATFTSVTPVVVGSWVTYIFDVSTTSGTYNMVYLIPENGGVASAGPVVTDVDDIYFTNVAPTVSYSTVAVSMPGFARTATTIDLYWTMVPYAASYNVLDGKNNLIQSGIKSVGTNITGLSPNTTYAFKIQAVNAAGVASSPSIALMVFTRGTKGTNYELIDDFQGTTIPVPIPTTDSVTVTVDQTKPGIIIPANFQGLSYETSILANAPGFLNVTNPTLIQLIKNLGSGILRLGGNSSDDVIWTGTARTGTTPSNSLTTTEIDNLRAFDNAIGWPVIFGLNMGEYNPTLAANEANYVTNSLNTNLYALQFGNEPDGYHSWNPKRTSTYAYTNYKPEFESYLAAVKSVVPAAPIAGPDAAYRTSDWVIPFASTESANAKLLTIHYYQNGPSGAPGLTVNSLFTTIPQYNNYFVDMNNASTTAKLPWRITECNSINGGGQYGISDVFGSALWALDFMWMVAENGGQGVNFHGSNNGAYSPFVTLNGITTVRPIYYSFLAFKYGTEGNAILPATLGSTTLNCSAYACEKTGLTSITLINKDAARGLNFKIQLSNKASTIHIARLTAPNIISTSGISFCSSSTNTNGTFTLGKTEDISVGNKSSFTVNIPAASAAVVTVE